MTPDDIMNRYTTVLFIAERIIAFDFTAVNCFSNSNKLLDSKITLNPTLVAWEPDESRDSGALYSADEVRLPSHTKIFLPGTKWNDQS